MNNYILYLGRIYESILGFSGLLIISILMVNCMYWMIRICIEWLIRKDKEKENYCMREFQKSIHLAVKGISISMMIIILLIAVIEFMK